MTELTLRDIFKILLRRIWLIMLLPFVAVVAATLLVYYVIVPVYTATATMYVLNKQSAESVINYNDLQSSALLTADYRELVLSKRVLSKVAKEYGLDPTAMRQNFGIEVTSANNTRVIEISVTSSDPVLAANLANSIGKEFSSIVIEIMDANNVSFVDVAEPPMEPSAPRKLMIITVAGLAALMLAMGLAILLETLNTTIRTVEDVEKELGLSVLARVPRFEVK